MSTKANPVDANGVDANPVETSPAQRWRVGTQTKRPIVNQREIQIIFIADHLDGNGGTRPDAPGPAPMMTMADFPELLPITPESLEATFLKSDEGKAWTESRELIAESTEAIKTLETSLAESRTKEFTRENYNLQAELISDLEYEQKRLQLAVDGAQAVYDAASRKASDVLRASTSIVYSALLDEQIAIYAELAAVVSPILDKMARNKAAMRRHQNGVVPNIGPRPTMPDKQEIQQNADWNTASPQPPALVVAR